MRFPFIHYLERGDDEYELAVIYDVTPFYPATRLQPAEGGEIEIISVKRGGLEFALTDAEEAALITECQARVHDDIAEEAAAATEWKAQARRDDLLMRDWED